MTGLHIYTLRAGSEAALIALLEEAQAGKPRPFIFEDEGIKGVDASRITFPKPELDGDEPTGMWLCEVRLTEPDPALGALAPD